MRVGIVGLGNMGGLLAAAMLRSGLETCVYDLRDEAVELLVEQGARAASSITELAQACEVVGVVVLTETQVDAVAEEVAALGLPRTLVVHSTVTPAFVQQLAERLATRQVTVLDAPVAGGVARARTGDLTVMVGGAEDDVAALAPVLEAIAREVFHVGPAGAGSAAKLCVNYLTIAGYALHVEAMDFARAHGLTEDALTAVLTTSSADSRAVRTWGFQDRLRRNAPPGTAPAQDVMKKDLTSFATAGGRAGLVLPLGAVAAETLLGRLEARDAYLDGLGEVPPVPRCASCGLELAAPFQQPGTHPECRQR